MGLLAVWFMLANATTGDAGPVVPRCVTQPTGSGLFTTTAVDVCDPAGGCLRVDVSVAIIDGCFGLPRLGENVSAVRERQGPDFVERTIEYANACSSQVRVRWTTSATDVVARAQLIHGCGDHPRSPPTVTLTRSQTFPPTLRTTLDLVSLGGSGNDDDEDLGVRAALENLLRAQDNPAACATLDALLQKQPHDDASRGLAERILQLADAPCLVSAATDALFFPGLSSAADRALVRLVSHPPERFRLITLAARNKIATPVLSHSMPSAFTSHEKNVLLSILPLGDNDSAKSHSVPQHAERRTTSVIFDAIYVDLVANLGPAPADALILEVLPRLNCAASLEALQHVRVLRSLADVDEKRLQTLLTSSLKMNTACKPLDHAWSSALLYRLEQTRSLSAANWRRVVVHASVFQTRLDRLFSCDRRREDIEIPPNVAQSLVAAGIRLQCVVVKPSRDDVAFDPMGFDSASQAPSPANRARTLDAIAPALDAPARARDSADVMDGSSTAKTPSGVPTSSPAATPRQASTVRTRTFSDGISIAPFGAAIAFFDGPVIGGGIQAAWHLSERFSLVGGTFGGFSCAFCVEGTTGTRTDLRLDLGASVAALPHLDFGPFARLSMVVSHIEIIEGRRGVFHDAIGPELTLGLDWLPTDAARLFVETSAFWLVELTRTVRPGGQVAPSPRGISPVDGSTSGVVIRVGIALRL